MRTAITTVLLAASFGACTSSTSNGDDTGQVNCATETRADHFVIGLEKPGEAGMLDFKLMQATPAPPASGDNAWQIQINTMSSGVVGNALTGATIKATPYMPDHMHTSPIKAKMTDLGNGLYELSPINLWMPGLWETTVEDTGTTDKAVFRFCIPN